MKNIIFITGVIILSYFLTIAKPQKLANVSLIENDSIYSNDNRLLLVVSKNKNDSIVKYFNNGILIEEWCYFNYKTLNKSKLKTYYEGNELVCGAILLPENINAYFQLYDEKGLNIIVKGYYKKGLWSDEWINLNSKGDTLFNGKFNEGKLLKCNKCDTSFYESVLRIYKP